MREILFRGKRVDTGEWVYGFYFHHQDGDIDTHYIINEKGFQTEVRGETVGQFVGHLDKNGNKIFDGDLLNVFDWGIKTKNNLLCKAEVIWNVDEAGWNWEVTHGEVMQFDSYDRWRNIEIIGSIHDENP